MMFFPNSSVLLTIGNFTIHWYTVTLILGVILAYLYVGNFMQAHGYGIDVTDELLLLCLIGGFIGGRVAWVLEHLAEYQRYLPYIFAIGDGGFDILGAALGVMAMVRFYVHRKRMTFLRTVDVILPAIVLFACVVRVGRAIGTTTVWYTIAIDFVGFLLLHYFIRPYHIGDRRGDLAALSLMWLGLSRLVALITGWDDYASRILILAIIVEVFGILMYIIIHHHKPTKPIILFDLDGTLMDSYQMVLRCFQYLFKKYRDASLFTPEVQQEIFARPLREEMAKLFPEQDTDALMEEYRNYQASFSWSDEVSLFPHVKETLDALWNSGYTLGIVSTRMSESCESWIRQLELSYCFSVIVGRDLYNKPKPQPDGIFYAGTRLKTGHDSCIYIGDNISDVEAGKAAGVYTIAYLSDIKKKDALIQAAPNKIIVDMAELLELLKEDHEWSYEKK